MRSVEWSAAALRDAEAIDDYLADFDPDVAEAMLRRFTAVVAFLAQAPAAGPLIRDSEARKWSVRGTDYILLYRIHADRIEILRVHHGREDWCGGP